MKKATFLTVLCIIFYATLHAQQTETFIVNPTKSLVKWAGKMIIGGSTEGTILIKEGTLDFENKQLKSGKIIMNTKSISSGKAPPKLVAHLKNEDFFAVEQYPRASLVITSVIIEKMIAKISGKITIKGVTRDITFGAKITYDKDVVVAKVVDLKVNRKLFDLKFKSDSFLSGIGDSAIKDDFILDIILIGEKKS